MKALGLHYEYDCKLPGGISHPRLITVIHEKLDLIERFLNLHERVGQEERTILKELRNVELNDIKDIIMNIEKSGATENKEEKENINDSYNNLFEDLQKQFEDIFKGFNKKATN